LPVAARHASATLSGSFSPADSAWRSPAKPAPRSASDFSNWRSTPGVAANSVADCAAANPAQTPGARGPS
jgi:hypothetical protein